MTDWSIKDMPDLSGKRVIVTGGNSGIGYETVRISASHGAHVIMASRNMERGQAAVDKIMEKHPGADVVLMQLDLNDLESISTFAAKILKQEQALHYLFNNAGIMMHPYGTTKQGFEQQFGVNHLGHFALTSLLLPLIKATPGARVITTSSSAHKRGHIDFDNLQMKNDYDRSAAYSRSKVANIFFAYELQRKFDEHAIDAISVAVHPGLVGTNLATADGGMITNRVARFFTKLLLPLFSMKPRDGAMAQLRAAYEQGVKGGTFYQPHKGMRGKPVVSESVPYTHDLEVAKQLWQVSEQMTGISYQFD